jgi:hypothetical protein
MHEMATKHYWDRSWTEKTDFKTKYIAFGVTFNFYDENPKDAELDIERKGAFAKLIKSVYYLNPAQYTENVCLMYRFESRIFKTNNPEEPAFRKPQNEKTVTNYRHCSNFEEALRVRATELRPDFINDTRYSYEGMKTEYAEHLRTQRRLRQ